TRGCTLQLVYTSPDVALRGLDQGVRTRVGRSRALRHRVSRFVVSLLPRAQRSPPDGDGHAPSASPALLRADGDARVGARLPRAVPHRAEGRRSVRPQTVSRTPRRTRPQAVSEVRAAPGDRPTPPAPAA